MQIFKELIQSLVQAIINVFGLACWVNVYSVTRAFGGTDEGGSWYYRQYACLYSRQVWIWESDATLLMLRRQYERLAWGHVTSRTQGSEIEVKVEHKKAAQQYMTRSLCNPHHVPLPKPEESTGLSRSDIRPKPTIHGGIRTKSSAAGKRKLRSSLTYERKCSRCKGSGKTRYKHVEHGICFQYNGHGKIRYTKQAIAY